MGEELTKVNLEDFTEHEKAFLCFAIRFYGTDDHPWPDKVSLPYFIHDYVKECVEKALEDSQDNTNGKTYSEKVVKAAKRVLKKWH